MDELEDVGAAMNLARGDVCSFSGRLVSDKGECTALSEQEHSGNSILLIFR